MKTFYLYAFACISLFLNACTKGGTGGEQSAEDVLKKKADDFTAAIRNNSFRLTAFYSDKPIDYDQSDNVVKQETDLWAYIRPYIVDDINSFQAGDVVIINQGDIKWSGDSAAQIQRNYSVSYDTSNVYLTFVDYDYNSMKYKLSEYNSASMLLYVDWPGGAKLFSKFEVQQYP